MNTNDKNVNISEISDNDFFVDSDALVSDMRTNSIKVLASGDFSLSESGEKNQSESNEMNQSPGFVLLN